MMDGSRNRDYDDFFRTSEEKDHDRTDDQVQRAQEPKVHEQPQSYYYSYGPYRPAETRSGEQASSQENSTYTEPNSSEVITPAAHDYGRRVTAGGITVSNAPRDQVWQVQPPRRRGWWTSFLAAFVACALIMTGLVYASDVNNWFTGSEVNASGSNGSSGGNVPTGQTVSMDRAESTASAALPGSIPDIVEQASPAVVLIETYVNANRSYRIRSNMDFFEYFFRDRIQIQPDNGDNMINSGLGTGFIFDKDGYILTNEHVVSGADKIYVTVQGYTEPFEAQLLGSDFDLDLAVLKIKGTKDFPTLPIGDSTELRVGEWVTAIGNPLGYDHTVSVGVLSAKGRQIRIPEGNQVRYYEDLLQTDASINSGNSGGPLLNLKGEVVGINTAVSTDAQGIGFAIPSSTFVPVIDLLKNNQSIPKPYIGVGISNIEESWLEDLKLESTEGALVTQVEVGSPAERAGIRTWDVIIKIDDKKVTNYEQVKEYILELGVGARTTITVIRDGKEIQLGVIIGDRNNP